MYLKEFFHAYFIPNIVLEICIKMLKGKPCLLHLFLIITLHSGNGVYFSNKF